MSIFQAKPYNHQHILRFITAFGELFSGMTVTKTDGAGAKKQSYIVPIEYAPKNKWVSRLREQNDLEKQQVKITYPRIAFEMVDIRYAPDRKIGVNGTYALGNVNGMRSKIFPPAPYDVVFELYVATKVQGDSLQILEQILPYFQPYMTLNYEILPEFQIRKDIPIALQSYQIEDTFEGSPEDQRTVTQVFTFSAQMDFFGPTIATTGVIKTAMANIGFAYNNFDKINITAKVDPTTASKTDPHTIIETITETAVTSVVYTAPPAPLQVSIWDLGASVWNNGTAAWDIGAIVAPHGTTFWDLGITIWDNSTTPWDTITAEVNWNNVPWDNGTVIWVP